MPRAATLLWVAFAVFVLVTPHDARAPRIAVLGLVLVGGVYFIAMSLFRREVFEVDAAD